MKTSKNAYGAKAIIYAVNDYGRNDHGVCLGDMIIEDGRHYLVVQWTKNTSTGEVLPTAKYELDPAKLQALRGGRADFYYPDPIRLAEGENRQ
jgi:hypothetical protein